MMNIPQIGIILCSGISIAILSQRKVQIRKWGFVFGLMGQPFWFWSSVTGEQWGILAVSVWFTASHILGIKGHWGKKEAK